MVAETCVIIVMRDQRFLGNLVGPWTCSVAFPSRLNASLVSYLSSAAIAPPFPGISSTLLSSWAPPADSLAVEGFRKFPLISRPMAIVRGRIEGREPQELAWDARVYTSRFMGCLRGLAITLLYITPKFGSFLSGIVVIRDC